MRRPLLGLAAALAVVAVAPSGRAFGQAGVTGIGGGYDVFSFYYGYYLPHQAAIAAQPTPLDTISQITAQRQMAAQTDRSALYDPISPYGDEEDRWSSGRPVGRGMESSRRVASFSSHTNGSGPGMYYNRTARYFPGMRAGRGNNQNVARVRSARGGFGGGMGGMGGMGMPSMPGPR